MLLVSFSSSDTFFLSVSESSSFSTVLYIIISCTTPVILDLIGILPKSDISDSSSTRFLSNRLTSPSSKEFWNTKSESPSCIS